MKRIFLSILAALLTFSLGLAVARLMSNQFGSQARAEISPLCLEYTCDEARTTDDFGEFWSEFQSAVRSEKQKTVIPNDSCMWIQLGQRNQ
jgi:hypothetical protein